MRRCIGQWWLLVVLLALAACGGTPPDGSANSTPTVLPGFTATTTSTVKPTPSLPSGFAWYTSRDHTYQIAYPTGWPILIEPASPVVQFAGPNQIFEVSESENTSGSTPAQVVNTYCQAMQAGVAPNPVPTQNVTLAGQSWTRANCDAGAQGPAIELIVEVVVYQGKLYQMDYTSPIVEFRSDDAHYYALMEQSFHFLK